jgi:hypothetical protein
VRSSGVHGFGDVAAVAYVDMSPQPPGAFWAAADHQAGPAALTRRLTPGVAMAEEPGDDQPGPGRRRTAVTTQAVDESGLEQHLGQAVTHEVELELAALRPLIEARP